MIPPSFHGQLAFLSEANNSEALLEKVLILNNTSLYNDLSVCSCNFLKLDDSYLPTKVSKVIKVFLKKNKDQLTILDRPALERLQQLIPSFQVKFGLQRARNNKPTALEKTVTAAIHLTKEPTAFHRTISFLSQASDEQELVSRILSKYNQSPTPFEINPDLARKVSTAIKDLIKTNQNNLILSDAPMLKKLKQLLRSFQVRGMRRRAANKPTSLERTINVAINLAKEQEDPLKSLRPDEITLIFSYSSFEDSIKLALTRITPPKLITDIFAKASDIDVKNFAASVKAMFKKNHCYSKEMINLFFQHASKIQQKFFFETLRFWDDSFFNHIISALPNKMTYFTIYGYTIQTSDRAEKVVNKLESMTSLNSLGFEDWTGNSQIVATAMTNILKNPNRTLKSLTLINCNIKESVILAIGDTPELKSLESLNIAQCNELTNEGALSLINNPNMINLMEFNLKCRLITEETKNKIKAILEKRKRLATLQSK